MGWLIVYWLSTLLERSHILAGPDVYVLQKEVTTQTQMPNMIAIKLI